MIEHCFTTLGGKTDSDEGHLAPATRGRSHCSPVDFSKTIEVFSEIITPACAIVKRKLDTYLRIYLVKNRNVSPPSLRRERELGRPTNLARSGDRPAPETWKTIWKRGAMLHNFQRQLQLLCPTLFLVSDPLESYTLLLSIMRLCIQRVKSASVTVDGEITGQIGQGLMVLVGMGDVDGQEGIGPPQEELVKWACDRILGIKFWENEAGKPWKMSVDTLMLPVLLVSQFTLFTVVKKNKSLDFHRALKPDAAKDMYDAIVAEMQKRIGEERTQTGRFGAMMDVALVNDGPVTVNIDSSEGRDPPPLAAVAAVPPPVLASEDATKSSEE